MKRQLKPLLVACFSLLFTAPSALHAQLVDDGDTLDLTTGTNFASDLKIGNSSGNTTLNVLSPGALTNSNGFIGYGSASDMNTVTVRNTNAVWQNNGFLSVGESGAGNTLLVTNGGLVVSTDGDIGWQPGANNNQVVLAGPGSAWNHSGDFWLGAFGSGNSLVITDGATMQNDDGDCYLGFYANSSSNQAAVTGLGSVWTNNGNLTVGQIGPNNALHISEGATVQNKVAYLGFAATALNNRAVVTGTNSAWQSSSDLVVGNSSLGNSLIISNGATVQDIDGRIGYATSASNNQAVVSGSGSAWNNSGRLIVGQIGPSNSLLITEGGIVNSGTHTIIGEVGGTNNLLRLDGGSLVAGEIVDVRRGTLQLDSGSVSAQTLLATLPSATVALNGGTLSVTSATVTNAQPLTVGNGSSAATLELWGSSQHRFSAGLVVASNGLLKANGILPDSLTVQAGGSLSVGTSLGTLTLSNSPGLHGTVLMEISKSGSTLTNDRLQVEAPLTYGGSLTVSDLGPDPLSAGDTFQLFSASSYGGANTAVNLPTLPDGLGWSNRLAVDGSITVVTQSLPAAPIITGVTRSGANLIFSVTDGTPNGTYDLLTATNLALPVAQWTRVKSVVLDPMGTGTLTDAIDFDEPQRFYRLGEAAVIPSPPTITGTFRSGTNLVFSVTGGAANGAYDLLTATNLALPMVEWTLLGSGQFNSLGEASLTNGIDPTEPERYYRLRTP